jgi:Ala-tRNA(Pro) deacylase
MDGWTPEALLKRLDELGIETTTVYHPAAPTVAEHSQHVGHLGGGQAKQLFLRSKCGKQFLVSCLIDTEVDLKVLSERCGVAKSKPLRLTTYEVMTAVLKVSPGSVTPFAIINADSSVRLLLDARFKSCERLLFHPLTNDATTLISPDGLVAFLASIGRKPEWVDFSLPGDAALPPVDA